LPIFLILICFHEHLTYLTAWQPVHWDLSTAAAETLVRTLDETKCIHSNHYQSPRQQRTMGALNMTPSRFAEKRIRDASPPEGKWRNVLSKARSSDPLRGSKGGLTEVSGRIETSGRPSHCRNSITMCIE
jgi:hypothetical protein